MRIDRYISNATGISRRLVHREIKSGNVAIDGKPVKTFSVTVNEGGDVTLNGEPVVPAQHLYLMLNKPEGTVCANHDVQHPTVIDLLDGSPDAWHPTEPLQIVGRLDADTTGLVLLTTDGHWNHKITSPSGDCSKCYIAELAEPISDVDIATLEAGITLKSEKKTTLPCTIKKLTDTKVTIELHEGKYHQVKRMFASVGNSVTALHRERIGGITLPGNLLPGDFRALSIDEIKLV